MRKSCTNVTQFFIFPKFFNKFIFFYSPTGAHINPSITMGMAVVRAISPLRAAFYMTAQCGGGIAGAALLYG